MSLFDFKFLRGGNYGEINLNPVTVEVRAGVRRLRATWTPELAQTIERYHNVDIEEEMTRMLSEELAQEIDREIMRNIIPIARRVNARTMAEDIVPIQPLPPPNGILHYIDSIYGDYNFKNFKLLRG